VLDYRGISGDLFAFVAVILLVLISFLLYLYM